MARATRRHSGRQSRCRLHGKNETHTNITCDDGHRYTLDRERSRPPSWVAEHARTARRRCADADEPPTFRTPGGASMHAPSSFGVHARISAERFLASDLHHMLCEKRGLNCTGLLAADGWATGEFLQALLEDPSRLFTQPLPNATNSTPARPAGDEALWEVPWVSCRRQEPRDISCLGGPPCEGDDGAYRINNCTGNIPRAEWMDATRRPDACRREMTAAGDEALAMNITLCDLDGVTAELCRVIAEAEADLVEAACLAAGACRRDTFYYYPGMYSTTNEEFVRETVQELYLDVDELACDEAASERAAFDEQIRAAIPARRLLAFRPVGSTAGTTSGNDNAPAEAASTRWQACSALSLTAVTDLLEQMRTVLHTIVRLMYYFNMVLLTLFRFIGAVNFELVLSDLFYYLRQLLNESLELIKAFGEMAWE
eukprot:3935694-Rhodomonas_salina.1